MEIPYFNFSPVCIPLWCLDAAFTNSLSLSANCLIRFNDKDESDVFLRGSGNQWVVCNDSRMHIHLKKFLCIAGICAYLNLS